MSVRPLIAGILVVLCSTASAQTTSKPTPTVPTAAAPTVVPGTDAPVLRRAPLLREGSFIARSPGTLRLDKKRNEWIFAPDARDSSGLQRELVVLPNDSLGEATRTLALAPRELRFEATGQLFIYQGRNFLLLSMATPIAAAAPSAEVTSQTPAAATQKSTPTSSASPVAPRAKLTAVDEEKIAEELERQLLERIQSIPRPSAPTRSGEVEAPAASEQASSGGAAAESQSSMRIQSRRGYLLRDGATGGWRFVFEGQLPEGSEPSMPVLPCLALERVESMIRLAESQVPIVVSGTTTVFEGRTFLLPSSFRLARGGKGVNP